MLYYEIYLLGGFQGSRYHLIKLGFLIADCKNDELNHFLKSIDLLAKLQVIPYRRDKFKLNFVP